MNIIEIQLQLCLNKIENGQWIMDLNSPAQKLLAFRTCPVESLYVELMNLPLKTDVSNLVCSMKPNCRRACLFSPITICQFDL